MTPELKQKKKGSIQILKNTNNNPPLSFPLSHIQHYVQGNKSTPVLK